MVRTSQGLSVAPKSFEASQGKPLLIRNVRIGSQGRHRNLRVKGGQIVWIGDAAQAAAGDSVVDAQGRTVLPGFWDAHVHAVQWACARRRVDLSGAASASGAAEIIREELRRVLIPTSEPIVGYGFRDGLWPDTPHKSLLQTVAPDRRVILVSNDLHTAWASPAALLAIGRGDHPTGVLREQECLDAVAAVGQAPVEQLDVWVAEATRAAAQRGVTGFTDYEFADNLADWRRRVSTQDVATRVACSVYPAYVDAAIARGLRTGDHLDDPDGLLEVGPVKLFVDGSLNTRTAYCYDPYPDTGAHPESHGVLTTEPDQLVRIMRRAAAHGLQPALHAIGDQANSIALDAFEEVGCGGRIEHAQMLRFGDASRFAMLGVVASVQPGHALGDRDVAERHWPGRTAQAFPYADLLAAGARLEFGSDAPVAPLDPWHGIAAAVSRKLDERPPWHPEQSIPIGPALVAASRRRRHVHVGDVADLVIVDQDPAEAEPTALRAMPVSGTLLGGHWTFRAF